MKDRLTRLALDESSFEKTWETRLVAIVEVLHRRGVITWDELATLSPASPEWGRERFGHWLDRLEHLAIERGMFGDPDLDARQAELDASIVRHTHD